MNEILKCENLNKSFGKKQILKGISLSIKKGDILAFIGPNGAGKTTTIKLILGLQTIDSGNVFINNYNIKDDYVHAIEKVGSIVENPDSYMYLSGYDNLKLIGNLYYNVTKEEIESLLKIVDLDKVKNEKVSKYSLGMRQRLGIAKSLINKPNLLILDEPTNGLDPAGIKKLRDLLQKLAKNGMGILISSHNLAELESFCNKVCVIKDGVIVDTEEIGNFKKNENKYYFEVSSTEKINFSKIKDIKKNSFILEGTKNEVADMVKNLVKKNIDIYEIKQVELTLEEAFLKKMGVRSDKLN